MLKSLHARLVAWLVVPLLFLSTAHLISTYVDTRKTAETIFDKLLTTLALSISQHALASGGDLLTDDVLELIRETTNDNLYYKVIGPDYSFIMGYEDIPEPPGGLNVLEQHLLFYDATYFDNDVRVVAISSLVDQPDASGWTTTFVAQTLNDRDAYVSSILTDAVFRVALMIVIAAVLLSLGISLGLRPLRRLEQSVSRRDINDLSPIRQDNLPREVDSVVTALNALLHRLQSTIAVTKRFVENAAHQLRTPVTALLPQSELALRHAESDRERNAVGKIRRSAEKIARLTNQLLNLTYAESITLAEGDYLDLDLSDIACEYVDAFQEEHAGANITLDLQPAPIQGRRLLIGEVVENLLDNACKYAGESSPITIRTYTENSTSILDVIDAGAGVAPEDREKVFERFFRGDNSPPGSGLGLSIVREIVQAHRGTVSIASGPEGEGACFSCRFPQRLADR